MIGPHAERVPLKSPPINKPIITINKVLATTAHGKPKKYTFAKYGSPHSSAAMSNPHEIRRC